MGSTLWKTRYLTRCFFDGDSSTQPNGVTNVGLASPYGTFGQNGNVFEWDESAFDGINNSSSEARAIRGGDVNLGEDFLRSSVRLSGSPSDSGSSDGIGFRVASVPEPTASMLMIVPGWMWMTRRRRESAL